MKPLVSISVVTYNHANYIKECLDGILMQQTSFPFEIILGEDESNDGTREICLEYAKKYPDKIKLFLRSRKDVIYINGNPTGRFNMIENLKAAKGKYIALCEGDDYWTDPFKLQKQVNQLVQDKDIVLSFHSIKILNSKGNLVDDFITNVPKKYQSINDLAEFGNYIHTPSVVFKNIIKFFPFELKEAPFGDYFLYMMLAEKGKIAYINDKMAVYRYQVGMISKMDENKMILASVKLYSCMLSFFKDDNLKRILIKKQQGVVNHYLKLLILKNNKKYFLFYNLIRIKNLIITLITNPRLAYKKIKNYFDN